MPRAYLHISAAVIPRDLVHVLAEQLVLAEPCLHVGLIVAELTLKARLNKG